ncbi:solute carrier family 66 member 2 isoform X5 [Zerene cesonia]|uniref:solute carrier family 66 member 2 isoform X5 n=1 Tax=Zerene cesonia TaxID=33412 RepID=UPI0018E5877A|nr:solute carrier family 66 member 2 isoform X5 [Zerene cesonia]
MDWIISDELGLTVGHLVGWGAAGAMIIGGIAPYIPQYKQIKKTQDAEGFSLYVCLTLLIANTLRILFWFGKRYEIPLLIQSIVMNITMFIMIHLCVNVRKKNQIIRARERIFTAQPDETARWLGQQSGVTGGEKPRRFYATSDVHASNFGFIYHGLVYCHLYIHNLCTHFVSFVLFGMWFVLFEFCSDSRLKENNKECSMVSNPTHQSTKLKHCSFNMVHCSDTVLI